jgi:hypothetical protein
MPDAVFEIEWGALTADERDELMAQVEQRKAHGGERMEALQENIRVLEARLVLQVERAPGMTLRAAIGTGRIGILEVIEAIRGAVPDPLAQQ